MADGPVQLDLCQAPLADHAPGDTTLRRRLKMLAHALIFGLSVFFLLSSSSVHTQTPALQTRAQVPAAPFLSRAHWVDDYYTGDVFAAFEEAAHHENAFILFYAPWDADSVVAVQALEDAGQALADHRDLYLAAVNCWVSAGDCYREFGAGHNTHHKVSKARPFPILVFYPRGRLGLEYHGPLTARHLVQFLQHAQDPLVRIDSLDDLYLGQAQHGGQTVVGHFPSPTVGLEARLNYQHFVQMAFDLLEFDPFRTLYGSVAVVVSSPAAYALHLQPPHQPVRLFHWNGTSTSFPNKTISSAGALLRWVADQSNPLTSWSGASGRKSLNLASNLALGTGHSLLAFIPRALMGQFNTALAIVQEAALRYYSCTHESRQASRGLIDKFKYLRKISDVDLETQVRACLAEPWFSRLFCSTPHSSHACLCSFRDPLNRTLGNLEAGDLFLKAKPKRSKMGGPIEDETVRNAKVARFRLQCSLLVHNPDLCRLIATNGRVDVPGLDTEFLEVGSEIDGLGCEDNKTLNFYTLDEITQQSLAARLGVDLGPRDEPTLVLVSQEREATFLMEDEFTLEGIANFVSQFHKHSDTLSRIQRSSPPVQASGDMSNNLSRIPHVTSENFASQVLDSSQNIVLLYTSPACGFCSSIVHTFHTLKEQLDHVISDDLVFFTVDAMHNDLPWTFTALSVPSVLFFRAGKKSETRVFPSDKKLDVPNLLSFIMANLPSKSRRKISLAFCDDGCLAQSRRELKERLRNALDFSLEGNLDTIQELRELEQILNAKMNGRLLDVEASAKLFDDRRTEL